MAVFQFNVSGYGASHNIRVHMAIALRWRISDGSGGLRVGSALYSLPVNTTDRAWVVLRLDEATRNDDVSGELALLAVERAVPIRRFFACRLVMHEPMTHRHAVVLRRSWLIHPAPTRRSAKSMYCQVISFSLISPSSRNHAAKPMPRSRIA